MLRLALRHCLQAVLGTRAGADDPEASALTRPLAAKLLRIRPNPAQQLAEAFDVARGILGGSEFAPPHCWLQVGSMTAYVGFMLALYWFYVGSCWDHVGSRWLCVGSSWFMLAPVGYKLSQIGPKMCL